MQVRRVVVAAAVLTVLAGAMPGTASAAGNTPPVALDDPAIPGCQSAGSFGGAFPIPEDWDDDFLLGLGCGPTVNDSDADGDPLTLELVGQPAHGDAQVIPGQNWITYRVDADYSTIAGDQAGGQWVSDTIRYRLFDGTDYSNTAGYRLWITPVNDAPTFTPGPTVEAKVGDGAVSVPWASDVSPGPGTSEAGQHVTFEITANDAVAGVFAVAPAIDEDGTLTFTPGTQPWLTTLKVRAHDDGGLQDWGIHDARMPPPDDTSDEVTFQIVVWPADPAAPVAVTDELQVTEDTPVTGFHPLDNDADINGDTFQVTQVGVASKGTASLAALPGSVDYVPDDDATGSDSFTYTVTDSTGRSSVGTVNVTIAPVNDAPVATDDVASVAEGAGPTVIGVLGNDDDVDEGDTLAVTDVGDAGHGTTTLQAGVVRYAPDPGYTGNDSFDYTVSDGALTATATVSVTVQADALPPVVNGLTWSIATGSIGTSTVLVRLGWVGADPALASGVASYQVQVQVGIGAWQSVALPTAAATSAIRSVPVDGTIRFRVRAADARGNLGAFATSAAFTVRRPQETAGAIAWRGTWARADDPRLSGGHSRYTSASGRRATFTFTGRSVAWVARPAANGGRAAVWVDGVKVATVDLRSTSAGFRRIVFRRDVAPGRTHRIEIRPLGDGRVDLDAFVVLR